MEEKTPVTNEEIVIIKDAVEKLLSLIQVTGEVSVTAADDGATVSLATEDSGIVIGYHGEGLDGLQLLLSLMISRTLGRFVRVSVDVGDYKKNRTEYLERLAMQVKERALQEDAEQALSSLKPWERRVVHMLLQNDEEVETASVGEGKERTLVVRPKAK